MVGNSLVFDGAFSFTLGAMADFYTLLVKAQLNLKVEKEYRFHPVRKWRADYAIESIRVLIEVEGGIWTQGRHTRGKGYLGDMEKYNAATVMGWKVLRYTPDQLHTKSLEDIQLIVKALQDS